MVLFILYESASGYGLFERVESEAIVDQLPQVQESISDMGKFSKIVKLRAFLPFTSEKNALEEINSVSEGVLSDYLKHFLEQNLPKSKDKKSKNQLGVSEEKLAAAITETLSTPCTRGDVVLEIIRGIRTHFSKFIKELKDGDIEKAQLGLGHAYSRGKVKFNVNRVDNMIIQSISLLDQLEKDVNTFTMRVKEWYGWHFPELIKVIPDMIQYAAVAKLVGNKGSLNEEKMKSLEELLGADKAKEVLEAAKHSMGTDISEFDLSNIERFATKVTELAEYRKKLHAYLQKKMHDIAPNLSALIGEQVGARLISHAGSLTSLAKYPASTVQILGAEKALFRALKTKGNTPKYGLIFHSSFIGKAGTKNKGRISRYLANKCSIAARIDAFTDVPTTTFGDKLKDQVSERLSFYETGQTPRKNIEVMKEALAIVKKSQGKAEKRQMRYRKSSETPGKKKKRTAEETAAPAPAAEKSSKKKKKSSDTEMAEPVVAAAASDEDGSKKKKKKEKKKKEKKDKKDKKKDK